jgi:hypothetical protein
MKLSEADEALDRVRLVVSTLFQLPELRGGLPAGRNEMRSISIIY